MNRMFHLSFAFLVMCLIGISSANLHAAAFSDDNWSNIGNILNEAPLPRVAGEVIAVATDGSGNLYVGGDFTIAGGVFATNIAKWNGSTWSALGSGVDGEVWALAISGSNLYVGGDFTIAGGVFATNIAEWNGSTWSALGSGVDRLVTKLAVSGSDLYAGGYFRNAGGIPAENIAKWNGSSWSALGSGLGGNAYVYALAASGSNLYLGGEFSMAGGVPANNIARWDGSSWNDIGLGIDGYVYALAVSGSKLYVGGEFTTAGGVPANNIAWWNGANWSALASGITAPDDDQYYGGEVGALAVSGTDLYAGGYFTSAGGLSANSIAKWNGNSWSALGSGMNEHVFAASASGSDLCVGGRFTAAGGKVAGLVAKARISSIGKSVVTTNSAASIQFSGVTGYQYDVQRATNLTSPITWTTLTTSPLSPAPDGSFTFTDTNTPPGTAFYRARELP